MAARAAEKARRVAAARAAARAAYRVVREREQEIAEAREWARFQVFAAESMRKFEEREALKAEVAARIKEIEAETELESA
jgi:hypothetical protein